MWAVKPHYYFSAFYNYPYTFGLLFGLGPLRPLRGRTRTSSARATTSCFGSTGMADAAALAARFGIDIRSPEFWRGSLDVIRARDRPLLRVCLDRLRRRLSALVL